MSIAATCSTTDIEPEQEFALLHRPKGGEPELDGGLLERGEIDMRREVRLAGSRQRIGITMRVHRLQGVARAALGMAVIHDQRRDGRRLGARRKHLHQGLGAGPRLDDGAIAKLGSAKRGGERIALALAGSAFAKDEASIGGAANTFSRSSGS